MDDGLGAPFRKLSVTRWSRSRRRFAPPATAIGLLGVLFVAATVPFYGLSIGCVAVPIIALAASLPAALRYRRASRRLKQLPFEVRHHKVYAEGDQFSLNRVGIATMQVRVTHELDPLVCDAIAADAEQRVPGLSVTVRSDAGMLVLERWAWGGEDISVLAELLDTWGRELHDRATIRDLAVWWRAGAPV